MFDREDNRARLGTGVFRGKEEYKSYLKALGAGIADVKRYDTLFTFGMSEDGRSTIIDAYIVVKEKGADYYTSAKFLSQWMLNKDGLLSKAIFTLQYKTKVGDGACAADGTCASPY